MLVSNLVTFSLQELRVICKDFHCASSNERRLERLPYLKLLVLLPKGLQQIIFSYLMNTCSRDWSIFASIN